jgi:hypothetical protein
MCEANAYSSTLPSFQRPYLKQKARPFTGAGFLLYEVLACVDLGQSPVQDDLARKIQPPELATDLSSHAGPIAGSEGLVPATSVSWALSRSAR